MPQEPTAVGSILFAGFIGLVSVGTFWATLNLVNRKPNVNPIPPYVPLSPDRRRIVRSIDSRTQDLHDGIKLTGVTFRGEIITAKRVPSKGKRTKYVVTVGGKSFTYPHSNDAAAHFVAMDAARLAA